MSESSSFKYHHKKSLAFLDSEQHNLEYLFENLKYMHSISDKQKEIEEFITASMALSSEIDANFCKFVSHRKSIVLY
jgi:hypothetical protein